MAQLAELCPSILLSSSFSCLICNKNTHNLSFNIYTTFLSKSKDVSVHRKIIQIVETIDVLECELKKQKNKIESQFRKSVEARRNEANQQPILTNQIRDSINRHTLGAYNNADDIIEPVNPISGGSAEQVNDILSSFLATAEGNSQDSSPDLTCEQFISSLRTNHSSGRINFNQDEPIIEKLFTDDTGLNVIHDNEDTVNTITITERQANSEISVETVLEVKSREEIIESIEVKSREFIESKESIISKNSDNSLESSQEKIIKTETEMTKSLDVKIPNKSKENDNLSGHFSHPEDDPDDSDDPDDPVSHPNDTSDLNDTEKSSTENNKTAITRKKRKRRQGHKKFRKTIKNDIPSIELDPLNVDNDLEDWDIELSTNSPTEKSMTLNPFFCDLCEERFSTSIKLAKHREDVHSDILCHVCPDCGVRYREKAKLTRHLQSMHKLNPHHCQGCNYQAKSQNALDKHILDKHPDSKFFECDICNKKFSTYRYLHVVHMKRCHFGLPIKYRCDICNKGFVDKTAIDNHKITHSDIKDHICEFCGSSFRSTYSLRVHRNIHTKEVKYPCGDCDANFLRNANLIAHKKRFHNSGDGKLVCEICGKSFLTKRDLHRHQDATHPNANEKPLTCGLCEKSFYSKEKYKNHQMAHTVRSKYQCTLCSRVFAKKTLLQRHMTSLHYTKTRLIVSKQNIIENKYNLKQSSINKQIHVKNVLPSEDNSGEKESVIIIVNNAEVNPLSVFNVSDQISDKKSNDSQTLIPQTLESLHNVEDITSINQNHIKNITGTHISLPTPILLNTIEDNNPLQLNTEEAISSENATISYQEYINGVTLQSAACISLDSENLDDSHRDNFSNELLSGSRVLVPETGFTLITGEVDADETQTPSLMLASKDIHNYSKQASMILSNQDDLNSGTLSISTLMNKDLHNYSKQTPILKLASDVSDSNSGPFSAILLTNKDVNNESSESSILTLSDNITSSNTELSSALTMSNKNVRINSRKIDRGGPFTKLTLSNKDIGRNMDSVSLSPHVIPGEIIDSQSVEKTLPLTLVNEHLVEKIDVKEHMSLSFSAVEGGKEQHLVTEWF